MSSKVIAGRYELLEKIGDGGMAVVYKAKCRLLNRLVAVKILKPEFTTDEKFIENFRKESHAAASLSHSNIVSIYDVGREGNINYIVMELVEGKTLSQIIKEEAPLEYRQVIGYTKQIAAGLSAAHKHGIIHRDVKPHNILVNSDGVAKIADFGIAKAATTTTIIDNTSEAIMGSVHYFSPEQARGGYVDEKSDIYSLGIVMYEMITGKVPFDGDNPVSIALMHINNEMVPPSAIVDSVPPSLEKIVLKASNKYQTNRYESAEELIKALNDIELVTRVVGDSVFAAATSIKTDEERDYERQLEEIRKEESKNKDYNKSKKNRKKLFIILGSLVAALILFLVIGFATGMLGGKEVKVPDLRGMTYEEAKDKAEEAGLKVKKGDYVYSSKYEQDQVVSQDPKANEKVKKGQKITLNICKGKEEGVVPNLIGKTENEAKELIKKNGFKVGQVTVKTDSAKEGTVIEQNPLPGEEIAANTKISIIISDGTGKENGTVPSLVGLKLNEAKAAIEQAGYVVGSISTSTSEDYGKDIVMGQEYAAGSTLEKGKVINITVSSGSESSSVTMQIDFSEAKEEVFFLTVTVSDKDGTRNVISNGQRNKSSGGEEVTIKGRGKGTITVIFDNSTVLKKNVDFATGAIT